jgi:glycerol-3-phosphate cytidylyltransferase-like family protein
MGFFDGSDGMIVEDAADLVKYNGAVNSDGGSTNARNAKQLSLADMKVWNYKIQKCQAYKTEHGHLNIPLKDKTLGHFSDRMRHLYKRRLECNSKSSTAEQLTKIQKEKVAFMEGMGFAFDSQFDIHLQNLRKFKEQHGHTKVPIKYEPDRALGHWAELVRREHNKTNRGEGSAYLTADRLRKLATVGFAFTTVKQDPWEVTFEKFKQYKMEHGTDPLTSHEELGRWIQKQRHAYHQRREGTLKNIKPDVWDERESKLQEVGFVFLAGKKLSEEAKASAAAGRKLSWDDRLAAFVAWKERHGHPYVPTVTSGEDKHLGRWVAAQRMAYKAYLGTGKVSKYGKLTAEKALKLANAGFAFDAKHIQRTPKDVVATADADAGASGEESCEDELQEWL